MSLSAKITSDRRRTLGAVLLLSCALAGSAAACAQAAQDPQPAPAPAAPVADEVYFGPKFQKDRVVKYLFRADNMSTQQAAGQEIVDRSYTEYVMRFTVTNVHEDGSADFTMTYDRFYTEGGSSFFGGDYTFDSTTEAPDPDTDAKVTAALKRLAASTITFTADANGNIDPQTVKGSEAAVALMEEIQAIQGRAAEYKPEGLGELFASTWRVGNETYTRDVTNPWQDTNSNKAEGIGTWTFTSDYQLLQRSEDRVVLGMKMVIDLKFEPPEEEIEGMLKVLETKFDMIKGDWRYIWDPKRSELVERVGELEFNWLMIQEPIFEGDKPVRTNHHQRVRTSVTRLDD